MNLCVVVDTKDLKIDLKERASIGYGDIFRVSALWLTNLDGSKCLITKRKQTKTNSPGKWSTAVSGTVEGQETYESNILKEVKEEIGLTNLALTSGPKQFIDDGKHRFFCQWFFARVNNETTNLTLQEDEVDDAKWVLIKDLIADINAKPEKYAAASLECLRALGVLKN